MSTALRRLARMARGSPERARAIKRFAEDNLGLAYEYARRWRCHEVPMEDLRQQAVVGLLEAIHRWDPSRRTAFSSYAVHRMRYALQRYLAKKVPLVHVPQNVHADRRRARKVLRERPDASYEEIALAAGLSEERVRRALEAHYGLGYEAHQERDGAPQEMDLELRQLLRAAAAGDEAALRELAQLTGRGVDELRGDWFDLCEPPAGPPADIGKKSTRSDRRPRRSILAGRKP